MPDAVAPMPAATSAEALHHFTAKLRFETDCRDVHAAMAAGQNAFVLLDVRSPALYAQGHLPGAVNLPQAKIVRGRLTAYPADTPFVVYCAGPHCNGADKAAARLAALERPVKLMVGGVSGWREEGLPLVHGECVGA